MKTIEKSKKKSKKKKRKKIREKIWAWIGGKMVCARCALGSVFGAKTVCGKGARADDSVQEEKKTNSSWQNEFTCASDVSSEVTRARRLAVRKPAHTHTLCVLRGPGARRKQHAKVRCELCLRPRLSLETEREARWRGETRRQLFEIGRCRWRAFSLREESARTRARNRKKNLLSILDRHKHTHLSDEQTLFCLYWKRVAVNKTNTHTQKHIWRKTSTRIHCDSTEKRLFFFYESDLDARVSWRRPRVRTYTCAHEVVGNNALRCSAILRCRRRHLVSSRVAVMQQ